MKRKTKRFNGEEDSVVDDIQAEADALAEEKDLADARAMFQRRKEAKQAKKAASEDSGVTEEFKRPIKSTQDAKSETAEAPKKTSFSSAFATARAKALKGGPKTFEWEGKTYGTALKSPTQAKPRPSSTTAVAPDKAAKARSYDEARIMEAEQRRRTAAQTRAAGTTDMGALRRSKMDAYLPIDEQRIYSQFKKGGKVKSASARADGIAIRGKTRA